jgi:hypothetical protein
MSSPRGYVTAPSLGLALALAAAACATAEPPGSGGADARRIDARLGSDGSVTDAAPTDGSLTDARPTDARPVDAAVPVDAPGMCTSVVVQRLLNPAFDASPEGASWVQTPIDPIYPPITSDDGVPEHTAPAKAWMGGLFDGDDEIRQDVQIPAGTTRLLLRGVYDVRTDEFVGGVYDTSTVQLTTTNNAVLETVLSLDDDDGTAAWTPFQRIFTNTYAGQTVRVLIRSHNDDSDVSSFFYDTLALEATVCQ